MSDRELLERAARAAGIDHAIVYDDDDCTGPYCKIGKRQYWRPLQDDGDALRLAVKLGMFVSVIQGEWLTEAQADQNGEASVEEHYGDHYAATRRAIVRAAAELIDTNQGKA